MRIYGIFLQIGGGVCTLKSLILNYLRLSIIFFPHQIFYNFNFFICVNLERKCRNTNSAVEMKTSELSFPNRLDTISFIGRKIFPLVTNRVHKQGSCYFLTWQTTPHARGFHFLTKNSQFYNVIQSKFYSVASGLTMTSRGFSLLLKMTAFCKQENLISYNVYSLHILHN